MARYKEINAGENWEAAIDSAIDSCLALLLLLTENVASSQYVTYEWTRALTLGKLVMPIRLSKQATLHPRLEKTQYIDFTENSEQSWVALIARLSTLKEAYEEQQQQREALAKNENRRIYTLLKALYDARNTKVTTEDILSELRANQYLSLKDYANLIDMSRTNQPSSGDL